MQKMELKKYDQLVAVHPDGTPLVQHRFTTEPKVFTVETVISDGTFRVFQVGSYLKPLYFDSEGTPLLTLYNRLTATYKIWKNLTLVKKDDYCKPSSS